MDNKKQHHLPKCYLRNFANNELIWTYNKERSKKYQQNISSAGQQANFYKVSDKYLGEGEEKDDPNFIEKKFFANDIEPKFARVLQKVVATHKQWLAGELTGGVLNDEEQMELAALLGIQFLRMPYMQEKTWKLLNDTAGARLEMIKAFVLSQQENIEPADLENVKIHYDEEGKSIMHSTLYANQELVNQFQDALLNKYWVFQVAVSAGLYTSDHPMIVIPHLAGQPYLLEGFNTRGAEIIFPLTSSMLLTMYDVSHFPGKEKVDNSFQSLTADNLDHYNVYQYGYAKSDVYAQTDIFSLIDRCKVANNDIEYFMRPPSIKMY